MRFMRLVSVLVFVRLQLTAFKPHLRHKFTYHITGQLDAVFIHHDGGNTTSAC